MRVLTWNLFHGRSVPEQPYSQFAGFAKLISSWEWDIALLQEVPPWWPPHLARVCGAQERTALTSRNALLPLRRAIADRRPDLIKSNGGGANAILVRGLPIVEHRTVRLRCWPERRVAHAVRLGDRLWAGNLHAQVHSDARACADLAKAGRHVDAWAGGLPAIIGGDTNVRAPSIPGYTVLGGTNVDFVLGRGVRATGPAEILKRGRLSDHRPVTIPVA